jgi:serine/threonine protein kinase
MTFIYLSVMTCSWAATSTTDISYSTTDISCSAGSQAALAFSPRYAAPEIVRSFEAQELTIYATSAVDIWALGVMAYELLTDCPAFNSHASPQDVLAQLAGREHLPWEDPKIKDAKFRQLRILKRSVLKCLSRDPALRPSAAELLSSWEKLFDSLGADETTGPPSSRPVLAYHLPG